MASDLQLDRLYEDSHRLHLMDCNRNGIKILILIFLQVSRPYLHRRLHPGALLCPMPQLSRHRQQQQQQHQGLHLAWSCSQQQQPPKHQARGSNQGLNILLPHHLSNHPLQQPQQFRLTLQQQRRSTNIHKIERKAPCRPNPFQFKGEDSRWTSSPHNVFWTTPFPLILKSRWHFRNLVCSRSIFVCLPWASHRPKHSRKLGQEMHQSDNSAAECESNKDTSLKLSSYFCMALPVSRRGRNARILGRIFLGTQMKVSTYTSGCPIQMVHVHALCMSGAPSTVLQQEASITHHVMWSLLAKQCLENHQKLSVFFCCWRVLAYSWVLFVLRLIEVFVIDTFPL